VLLGCGVSVSVRNMSAYWESNCYLLCLLFRFVAIVAVQSTILVIGRCSKWLERLST
jgi:hypothetical protein